jgi:hypothetical protein
VCRIRDGSTNSYLSEDRAIEESLKTIEPRYNTALNNLIEGRIDRQSIYVIAGFAAYVIPCSPTAMRMLSRPLKSAVETMAVMHDERGLLPLPPEELGGRRLAEILESGDIQIELDPKYPQAIGIQNIFRHIAAFGISNGRFC